MATTTKWLVICHRQFGQMVTFVMADHPMRAKAKARKLFAKELFDTTKLADAEKWEKKIRWNTMEARKLSSIQRGEVLYV